MKKQNDDETNNSIDVNESKPTKKRLKTSTIIIIVLAMMLLFSCVSSLGSLGSSSSSTSSSTTTTEDKEPEDKKEEAKAEEPKEEPEPEAKEIEEEEPNVELMDEGPSIQEKDSSHFYIGDTINYESGTVVTITDVGIIPSNHYDVPVLWMDMEIDNQSGETDTWYSQEFSVYVDDYQVETSPVSIDANDDFDPFETSINPGRKAKFKFTSKLPSDYDSAGKIEIECPGSAKTILVKDNGVYLYGREEPVASGNNGWDANEFDSSWYRDYVSPSDRVLRITPDEFGGSNGFVVVDDFEYIIGTITDGKGILYLPISDDDVEAGTILFALGGVQIKVYSHSEVDGFYH